MGPGQNSQNIESLSQGGKPSFCLGRRLKGKLVTVSNFCHKVMVMRQYPFSTVALYSTKIILIIVPHPHLSRLSFLATFPQYHRGTVTPTPPLPPFPSSLAKVAPGNCLPVPASSVATGNRMKSPLPTPAIHPLQLEQAVHVWFRY